MPMLPVKTSGAPSPFRSSTTSAFETSSGDEPLADIGEAPRAVVQIELVLAIVLADEHEIEIAVAVEVGERDVLAVVLRARQLRRRVA